VTGSVRSAISSVIRLIRPAPPVLNEAPGADETRAQSKAIDAFLSGVTITPVRTSRLVDVKYSSPDPELANSPIIDESEYDEHAGSRDLELEEGVCYFNGTPFAIGSYVLSGSEVLECSGRGVWVSKGEKKHA
jgi:hypothetical protein